MKGPTDELTTSVILRSLLKIASKLEWNQVVEKGLVQRELALKLLTHLHTLSRQCPSDRDA